MTLKVLLGLPYDHKCDVDSFKIYLWEIYYCPISYSEQNPKAYSSMYKTLRPEISNT